MVTIVRDTAYTYRTYRFLLSHRSVASSRHFATIFLFLFFLLPFDYARILGIRSLPPIYVHYFLDLSSLNFLFLDRVLYIVAATLLAERLTGEYLDIFRDPP